MYEGEEVVGTNPGYLQLTPLSAANASLRYRMDTMNEKAKAEDALRSGQDAGPNRMVRFFRSDGGSKAQRDPSRAFGYPESSLGWSFLSMGSKETVLKRPSISDLEAMASRQFNTQVV